MILPFGVIISIVSQYFGGAADALGSQIRSASSQFHATDMWAAIVAACLLGLCAYAIGIAAEWAVNKRLLRQG
jgi:NitT/TauT family transport system permease protein